MYIHAVHEDSSYITMGIVYTEQFYIRPGMHSSWYLPVIVLGIFMNLDTHRYPNIQYDDDATSKIWRHSRVKN
jgi:hypothetical protein